MLSSCSGVMAVGQETGRTGKKVDLMAESSPGP